MAGLLPKQRKPNFLLIVLDDVWPYQYRQYHANSPYDDVDPHNEAHSATGTNLYVNTPWLDALAERGMVFTSAYGNPVCGADRASLLTGQYTHRHGIGSHPSFGSIIERVNDSTADAFFSHDLITTRLKAAGYMTSVVGKYQLSAFDPTETVEDILDTPLVDQFEHAETEGEFDDVRITWGNLAQQPKPLGPLDEVWAGDNYNYYHYVNGVLGRQQSDGNGDADHEPEHYSVTIQATDTINFIALAGETPWFCYLAFNSPHAPWEEPADLDLVNTTEYEAAPGAGNDWKNFQAQLESIDTELQRIQDTVDPVVWARTQVIFTSDNGFPHDDILDSAINDEGKDVGTTVDALLVLDTQSDGRTRFKLSPFEGGIRVPLIISGPGVLPGRTSDALFHNTDIYPTIVALAGGTSGTMDGVDQSTVLDGTASSVRTTSFCMRYTPNGYEYNYDTDWGTETDGGRRDIGYIEEMSGVRWKYVEQLWKDETFYGMYNLDTDPWELTNLYGNPTYSTEQTDLIASKDAIL